jgi:Zn-dependent M28 family amino/carboxypeptidase
MGIISAVAVWVTGTIPGFVEVFRYAALGTIPFVAPMWFFLGKPTPGAGDNLIASTIAVQLARIFRRVRDQGGPSLQHTRLVLASFDAEESGLRGAAAYAARHKKELHEVPTTILNMDSLYELDQLQFVTRDINGSITMPKDLVSELMELSSELGYPSRKFPMLFGAGGTDAAEFMRIGVPATTLLALNTQHFQKEVFYHTQKDTVDKIQPEVVKAALEIAWAFVWKREGKNVRM